MMDWTRSAALALLFLLAAVAGPRPAAAADATLYEVFENMSIAQHDGRTYREGWAALTGTARPGTLLCPLPVTCTLHATGASSVEVTTGKGTVGGDLKVVVQGDNDVDGPEAIVLAGQFSGTMDFSPALLAGLPYGIVVGTATIEGVGSSPFTGIFALPFRKNSVIPQYLTFTGLQPTGTVLARSDERLFGDPMVKFEICLGSGGC
jgi:hypothetical protein